MRLSAILAGCAIIALGACGGTDEANQATNDMNAAVEAGNESAAPPEEAAPATNESAATAAPAAVVAGAVPTREFMLGSWAEDGDCKMAITFKADGTMDGPLERWEFEDGKLE